jgi:MFS-type transporter involved in bile tolerance (Atg22 family)
MPPASPLLTLQRRSRTFAPRYAAQPAAPIMVGLIIESTGSYRLGLAALGIQSVLGALILFKAPAFLRESNRNAHRQPVT